MYLPFTGDTALRQCLLKGFYAFVRHLRTTEIQALEVLQPFEVFKSSVGYLRILEV
jgi:hypothetical protein